MLPSFLRRHVIMAVRAVSSARQQQLGGLFTLSTALLRAMVEAAQYLSKMQPRSLKMKRNHIKSKMHLSNVDITSALPNLYSGTTVNLCTYIKLPVCSCTYIKNQSFKILKFNLNLREDQNDFKLCMYIHTICGPLITMVYIVLRLATDNFGDVS